MDSRHRGRGVLRRGNHVRGRVGARIPGHSSQFPDPARGAPGRRPCLAVLCLGRWNACWRMESGTEFHRRGGPAEHAACATLDAVRLRIQDTSPSLARHGEAQGVPGGTCQEPGPLRLAHVPRSVGQALGGPETDVRACALPGQQACRLDLAADLHRLSGTYLCRSPSGDCGKDPERPDPDRECKDMADGGRKLGSGRHHVTRLYGRMGVPCRSGPRLGLRLASRRFGRQRARNGSHRSPGPHQAGRRPRHPKRTNSPLSL